MANFVMYDIESLTNVFLLSTYEKPGPRRPDGDVAVYYLSGIDVGDARAPYNENLAFIAETIRKTNPALPERATIHFHDLRDVRSGMMLANVLGGLSVEKQNLYNYYYGNNTPYEILPFYTDVYLKATGNVEKSYYLGGYNSTNYDSTMTAYFFSMAFADSPESIRYTNRTPVYSVEQDIQKMAYGNKLLTPYVLRQFSNQLFEHKDYMPGVLDRNSEEYDIRRRMLASGRHIDVSNLNEKQRKVGMKQVSGMLGYQILESDNLSDGKDFISSLAELADLIAYNVSDIVYLDKINDSKAYKPNFELKDALLDSYPEIVVKTPDHNHKWEVNDVLRPDRMTADSSSMKLSSSILCPNGHLTADSVVHYHYPSENKAAIQGIRVMDVLAERDQWFKGLFPDENSEPRQYWKRVYAFYKWVENKNFNITDEERWDAPTNKICMPYFKADGTPSGCYVTFSMGGIHGAEYNKALYDHDMEKYNRYEAERKRLLEVLRDYEVVKVLSKNGKRTTKKVQYAGLHSGTTTDIETLGYILSRLKTIAVDGKEIAAKDHVTAAGKWKEIKKPELFEGANDTLPGMEEDDTVYNRKQLVKRYVYTSYGVTDHQDFDSYYPNMSINKEDFKNDDLGYDRYEEVYGQKAQYGDMMKDEVSYTKEQRNIYSIKRNGTKLILNSATGAGDATFDNPICINNNIKSMRIIGQLFTWHIGQAETLEGVRVISTNTDGLFSIPVDITTERLHEILKRESAVIHVKIDPETTYLISKDTNNRIEYNMDKREIENAGGGDVSCFDGPDVTKALAHPAAIDHALARMLLAVCDPHSGKYGMDALDVEFDRKLGMDILTGLRDDGSMTPLKRVMFFQNIIKSSPSKNSYNFSFTGTEDMAAETAVKPLQHYNRVFYVKEDNIHLMRVHRRKKRLKKGEVMPHPDAVKLSLYCRATGENEADVDASCRAVSDELAVSRITKLDPSWNCLIENHDLHAMSDEQLLSILNSLDMNAYLALLEQTYGNWKNAVPEV